RPDHIPLDRFRAQLEGGGTPTRLREGRARRIRARGRPYLLAHAGARVGTGCLVRGYLAAGPVQVRRRRRELGAVLDDQRGRAVPAVDGHDPGWHPGRPETAFDHRRSTPPETSV